MGLAVGKHIVPDKPLPINDELVWDNGTPFPEPCIDRLAPTIRKYGALGWLCGGLSFFVILEGLAAWHDKASKIPFTSKVYPYDNLNERNKASSLIPVILLSRHRFTGADMRICVKGGGHTS